jgi:S-(hydroxymethyl)mycothiol dehydrogenase
MTLADGTPLSPALGIGAFAERTLVAAGQCTKVNPAARPEAVGLLGCGVMAGIGAAMYTGEVGPGDSVAVFGCGGVGCAAVAGSKLAGAAVVIAVDKDPRKLELAQQFGATHTVDAGATDPVEAIKGLTGGFGADVCIEAVGNPAVMEQAFFARDLAGTLVQVGVPTPEMRIDLPMIEFFGRGGALKPSWYGDCLPSRDFPMLVDLYLAGRLDLDRFVSETIGIEQVEEAFARMQRGEVLRSVVVL